MRTLRSVASAPRPGSRFLKATAVAVAIAASFALAPALRAQTSPSGDATKSVELVNAARSQAGLSALARNSGLDSIAAAQAERMATRDAIYHNPNLESDADAARVNWRWIGENVGVGSDVQAVHDAFMASPGHHDNIVYKAYNSIGVGVALAHDGSVFVAQAFADVVKDAQAPVAAAPPSSTVTPVTSAKPVAPVQSTSVSRPSVPAPRPVEHMTTASSPAAEAPIATIGGVVTKLDLGM